MLGGTARSVHAGEDNTIRLALIGCGGRGSGAVGDALSVADSGPVKLYAMADLVQSRMAPSYKALKKEFDDKIDVSEDRKFVGFDAYRKAIDLLRPGDIAMCTTRAYIRPVHVEYAVKKGINVFMEKPFAPDPGGLHRLLRAGEEAEKKGVKIAAGLQCRHSPARQALIDQIRAGAMGDITLIRANRLGGAGWLTNQGPSANDLMSQLQFGRIHLYWVGSGHMVDYLIHQIDECCWIKDAWPVEAVGFGGRVPGSRDCGQNLDVYSHRIHLRRRHQGVLRFPPHRQDAQRLRHLHPRHQVRRAVLRQHPRRHGPPLQGPAHRQGQHRVDAGKGRRSAPGSTNGTTSSTASATTGRTTKPSARSTPTSTTLMGRAACHTGQTVTWDQMMKSKFQFCDDLDQLSADSPAPVKADENGQFPVPIPGRWTEI